MSAPREPDGRILEANVARLLARAWTPVGVRPEFRARLAALVAERAARLRAPRVARPVARPRALPYVRIAAALFLIISLALAWMEWFGGQGGPAGPEPSGRSSVAVLEHGTWRELAESEVRAGIELSSGALSVVTPADLEIDVRVASGRVHVGPDARASFARTGALDPAADPRDLPVDLTVELERGFLALDHADGERAWLVSAQAGGAALHTGSLEFAFAATWRGGDSGAHVPAEVAAAGERGSARLFVARGESRAPIGAGGRGGAGANAAVIAAGTTAFLVRGELVVAGERSAAVEGERESLAAPAEVEEAAPVATAVAPSSALAVLAGDVHSSEGPLASFRVILLRQVALPYVAEPRTYRFTEAGGQFEIADVHAGTYTVFAQADGFATWQRRSVELAAGAQVEIEIGLDGGALVRGRVIDKTTRRPVEGAQVLSENDAPTQVIPFALGAVPEELSVATTDPQGAFELARLAPGTQRLRVTRAGYGAAFSSAIEIEAGASVEGIVLELPRSATIHGRVAKDDGSAWPDAEIVAALGDYTFERQRMHAQVAVSQADGTYEITDLPPGTYVVLNTAEPAVLHRAPRIRSVLLEEGARVRVDLPGDELGTRWSGRLLDARGEPLAGRAVTIAPFDDDHAFRTGNTGPDGSFAFDGLLPTTYLAFYGEEMAVDMVLIEKVELPSVPELRHDLVLGAGAIEGRVVERDSRSPVLAAVILARTDADDPDLGFMGRVLTDRDGRYRFEGLRPGVYRVTAYAGDTGLGCETIGEIALAEGQRTACDELGLGPGGEILVHVADGSGKDAAGVPVRLIEESSGREVFFDIEHRTDARGILRALGVKPGTWSVRAEQGELRASARIDVAPHETRRVELALARPDPEDPERD